MVGVTNQQGLAFPLNYSARNVNVKEEIVHSYGTSNINSSSFVNAFEGRLFSYRPVPLLTVISLYLEHVITNTRHTFTEGSVQN